MGGRASLPSRYDYSETTDIDQEDVARAILMMDDKSVVSDKGDTTRKAMINILAKPCFHLHPFVDYRFEKKIGEGAFSNVYKASQINDAGQLIMRNFSDDPEKPNWRPLRYAIKEIVLENLSIQQLKNVEHEIQILSQLNHEDIVRMYAVYVCDTNIQNCTKSNKNNCNKQQHHKLGSSIDLVSLHGKCAQLFIVLEYLQGGELLKAVCQRKRYIEDDARQLLLQIFQGIAYIHARGVIHRDIKPENLILSRKSLDSSIKIVDFGFATLISEQEKIQERKKRSANMTDDVKSRSSSIDPTADEDAHLASPDFLCGTPGYIAPEVLSDRIYTTSCDMWAAGVVMYILLSGTMPFGVKDIASVKSGSYSFPSSRWHSVSDEAKDLIRGLLNIDYEKRLCVKDALAHPWMTFKNVITESNTNVPVGGILSTELNESVLLTSTNSIVKTNKVNSNETISSNGILSHNLDNMKKLFADDTSKKFKKGLNAVRSAVRFRSMGLAREERRTSIGKADDDVVADALVAVAAFAITDDVTNIDINKKLETDKDEAHQREIESKYQDNTNEEFLVASRYTDENDKCA
jgi:calcium/calmodulin-dependent protein kinase I